jgi:hypothetical protein
VRVVPAVQSDWLAKPEAGFNYVRTLLNVH